MMTQLNLNLQRKKNYSKWRAISLIGVYILFAVHIIHWKIADTTLAPLELNEVLYTIHLGIITAGFIFMGVTIVGSVLFGRFFCSWGCHILALQDASTWILQKLKIRPGQIRSRVFFLVPTVAFLYLFVWPQVGRLVRGDVYPTWRVLSLTDKEEWASFLTNDYWRNLPSVPVTIVTFFTVGFLAVYLLGARGFCQNACPYGVAFGLADRLAPGKIKLSGDCNQCGKCTANCSSHVLVHKEIKEFGKVVNSNCLKDLDCVSVCPNDAIKFGFTKPSFFKSLSSSDKNAYSFSIGEEVLLAFFTLVFIAIYRGLYDTIPFLLAVSLSVIFAFLSIIFIRLFKAEYVHIGKFTLRQGNTTKPAGKIFCVIMLFIFLFSGHSAYVHYHTYIGDREYNKIISAGNSVTLSLEDEKNKLSIEKAKNHLELSAQWGLCVPLSLSRQLASIYLTENKYDQAEKYLKQMIDVSSDNIEARHRLAKLYYVTNREGKSIEELQEIIVAEKPKNNHDLRIQSEAQLMLGHIEEKNGFFSSAVQRFSKALELYPENAEASLALGIIYVKSGKLAEAEALLLKCSGSFPNSALIHNNLAMIYINQKKNDLAIHHLAQLIKLQPTNAQAHYNLGMMIYKSGETKIAIDYLLAAIELNHEYKNAYLALSMIYKKQGDEKNSKFYKDAADKFFPELVSEK